MEFLNLFRKSDNTIHLSTIILYTSVEPYLINTHIYWAYTKNI